MTATRPIDPGSLPDAITPARLVRVRAARMRTGEWLTDPEQALTVMVSA